jgi:outer membrane protein OmpA-like peptidoglycan-associated protein
MKKTLFVLLMALLSLQSAYSQQALEDSKISDNWYVGLNGGLSSKITHNDDFFGSLNPSVGIRVGRYWTPVAGWAVEGDLFFRDKGFEFSQAKRLKGMTVNFLGTLNLSNLFSGYQGQPRLFEVVALGGLGWTHVFDAWKNRQNDLVSKMGLDFVMNLDEARSWQFYVEPAISYNLTQNGRCRFDFNTSALQLLVGINYKFGNSNGTHNFKIASLRDQTEIDDLNTFVNELKGELVAKDKRLAQNIRMIATLEDSLEAAKNIKPTVVNNVTRVVKVNNNVLQPTVIFGQGKSSVDAAQMASVAMIAKYMKNHPESQILIKGYASPEGNPELNQKLSEARAASVKNALVNRYGIAASRLTTQGMGATDELFDEIDFNRVATFTDTTK